MTSNCQTRLLDRLSFCPPLPRRRRCQLPDLPTMAPTGTALLRIHGVLALGSSRPRTISRPTVRLLHPTFQIHLVFVFRCLIGPRLSSFLLDLRFGQFLPISARPTLLPLLIVPLHQQARIIFLSPPLTASPVVSPNYSLPAFSIPASAPPTPLHYCCNSTTCPLPLVPSLLSRRCHQKSKP